MRTVLDRVRTRIEGTRVFASPRARRRFAIHVGLAAVTLAVAAVVLRPHLSVLADATRLRAFIRGFGAWGPVVLVLVQALQVVVAPVPGQVLAVVAGYLFGPWWGTLYNMIGVTLGSTLAFWLSRRYGRAYVARIVHEETLARFDAIDDGHVRVTLFVLFLVPGMPDDVLCFVGGLTRVPLSHLVVIAVVGRAPAFFLVNVVGALFGAGQVAAAILLAALLVVVAVLGYLNRDRINRLLWDR